MRRLMNGILVTARTRQSQSPALGSSVKAHTPGGSESRRTIHHSSRRRSTPRRAWRIVHMRSRYTEVPRPPTKRPPGPGWRRPVQRCLALGTSAARLDPDRLCGCRHGIAETYPRGRLMFRRLNLSWDLHTIVTVWGKLLDPKNEHDPRTQGSVHPYRPVSG